jgi:hypothetical protein
MILTGIWTSLSAQEKRPPTEKTRIVKTSASSSTRSPNAAQTPFVEYNRDRITAIAHGPSQAPATDGPKRDWSNPPGFVGYSSKAPHKMDKHKQRTKKHKYHPRPTYNYPLKGRCPRF